MTSLYIVEQSAVSQAGHYFAYTQGIARAAAAEGLEVVVLHNRDFRGDWAVEDARTVAAFSTVWTRAEQTWIDTGEPGPLGEELAAALREAGAGRDDHVLLHTFGFGELLGLLERLTAAAPAASLPRHHLLLRYDPEILEHSFEKFAGWFEVLRASPALRRRLLFHADTEQLAARFERLIGVPVSVLPIPFQQDALERSLSRRVPRRPQDPIVLAYVGDARAEKGFAELPGAVEHLWEDFVRPGRVRFVLQSNLNTPGGEPGMVKALQRLARYNPEHVELIDDPLDHEAYYERLAQADAVLMPYAPERYRARSSGILVEALAAGKPVVTTAGSWMAHQVSSEHAVVYAAGALGPALNRLIDGFDAYAAAAGVIAPSWRERSSTRAFVRQLVESGEAEPDFVPDVPHVLVLVDESNRALESGLFRSRLDYLRQGQYRVSALFLAPEENDGQGAKHQGPPRPKAGSDFVSVFAVPRERGESAWEAVATALRADPPVLLWAASSTLLPLVDRAELSQVPIICEAAALEAFDSALRQQRVVRPSELEAELSALARCRAVLVGAPEEAELLAARRPDLPVAKIEAMPHARRDPVEATAGCVEVGDIVQAAGSAAVVSLPGPVDLALVVSDDTAAEEVDWFVDAVYAPYLAPRGVTLFVADARASPAARRGLENVAWLGLLTDPAPLYAAAAAVVVATRRSVVAREAAATSLSLGVPIIPLPGPLRDGHGILLGQSEGSGAAELAAGILDLLYAPPRLRERRRAAIEAGRRFTDARAHAEQLDAVLATVLGDRARPAAPTISAAEPPPPVRWEAPLQAANRLVRAWLENRPLEREALERLAGEPEESANDLLERCVRALLVDRSAPILRADPRILHRAAPASGPAGAEQALSLLTAAVRVVAGSPSATVLIVAAGRPVEVTGAQTAATAPKPAPVIEPQSYDLRGLRLAQPASGPLVLSQSFPLTGPAELFGDPVARVEGALAALRASGARLHEEEVLSLRLPRLSCDADGALWLDLLLHDGSDAEFEVTASGVAATPAVGSPQSGLARRYAIPQTPPDGTMGLLLIEVKALAGEADVREVRLHLTSCVDAQVAAQILQRAAPLNVTGPVSPSTESVRRSAVEVARSVRLGQPMRPERARRVRTWLAAASPPEEWAPVLQSLLGEGSAPDPTTLRAFLAPAAALGEGAGRRFVASAGLTVDIEAEPVPGVAVPTLCALDGVPLPPAPYALAGVWRAEGQHDPSGAPWLRTVTFADEAGALASVGGARLVFRFPVGFDLVTGRSFLALADAYEPEIYAPHLGHFWTGPGPRFVFAAPVALPRGAEVTVRINNFGDNAPEDLLLAVNGQVVSPDVEGHGEGGVLRTVVDRHDEGPAVAEIELVAQRRRQPLGDPRALGVSVEGIEFRVSLA